MKKVSKYLITNLEYIPLDSGHRRKYKTGAVRDRRLGKGRCDLLSGVALLELAKYMEACALPIGKYPARNWEKGIPIKDYIDSTLRHLFKFLSGQMDERHEIAAFWNIHCLVHTLELIKIGELPKTLLDNLPHKLHKALLKMCT